MMMVNGWDIDYTLLSRPDDPLPFTPEPYCQHAGADMACFVYYTAEYSINQQVGEFAVFRRKVAPQLIFHSRTLNVW